MRRETFHLNYLCVSYRENVANIIKCHDSVVSKLARLCIGENQNIRVTLSETIAGELKYKLLTILPYPP